MTRFKQRIKRCFCAVFGVLNITPDFCSSTPAICSGAIEQVLNSYTIHSDKEPAKPWIDLILPQFPATTQHNRGLFGASFAAINPQSTVSPQANRGLLAGTFAAIGGAA